MTGTTRTPVTPDPRAALVPVVGETPGPPEHPGSSQPHHRRGSEHGATTPPLNRWGTVDLRTLRAPKACRRCKRPRARHEFPLLADPTSGVRARAIRLWCTDCLTARKHLTVDAARKLSALILAAERAEDTARAETRARVEARAREHQETAALLDRALADDVFGAALLRAAARYQQRRGRVTLDREVFTD